MSERCVNPKWMKDALLTPFWIEPNEPRLPKGYGVTAYSFEDAIALIRSIGLPLPEDLSKIKVVENIRPVEIEYSHVSLNMGPIVLRGVWYPFLNL